MSLRIAPFKPFCPLTFALCLLVCFWLPPAGAQQSATKTIPQGQSDLVPHGVVQLLAVGPGEKEQNRECSATGFLIDEQGYLITAAHVVVAARRCLEKAPGAEILAKLTINDARTAPAVPCDVIGIDSVNDLALLKTERPLIASPNGAPQYMKLDARAVEVGTDVGVSGYPAFSWQPVTQLGHVTWSGRTRLEEIDFPLPDPIDALQVDMHLRPGNSGSPVYRLSGGVIGVVDKRDSLRPTYSIAVAIHYAIELAQRSGAPWHGVD
jgi:S1-C subfamily serine protease